MIEATSLKDLEKVGSQSDRKRFLVTITLQLMKVVNAGVVGVGGLILCKIDEDVVQQRDQYYQQQTANQMTAVDNDLMREENPAMPISRDRKSKVTFGGGTK